MTTVSGVRGISSELWELSDQALRVLLRAQEQVRAGQARLRHTDVS